MLYFVYYLLLRTRACVYVNNFCQYYKFKFIHRSAKKIVYVFSIDLLSEIEDAVRVCLESFRNVYKYIRCVCAII